MDRFYKEFGRLLREYREKAKLSQLDVSNRAGLKRTSITNIESGRQQVSLHQLFLLASAVGVEPHTLLPSSEFALPEESTSSLPTQVAKEMAKLDLGDNYQQWIERVVRKSIVKSIHGEEDENNISKARSESSG